MKTIPLSIGMAGVFVGTDGMPNQRAVVTRIWSETCVNLAEEPDAQRETSLLATSVFVPPLGTPADRHPAGYYFLPDAFVAASQAVDALHESDLVDTVKTDTDQRPQTFGQKAVGLQFNPSNQDDVAVAKAEAAALIDRAHQLRLNTENPEIKRMASLAITHAQEAQMWLVKAQTWKD